MKTNSTLGIFCCLALAGSFAIAGDTKDPKQSPAGMPKLPEGWSAQDMQACMEAGMPSAMHEQLKARVGVWKGTNKMWMGPGSDSMTSDTTWTVTSIMEGRFIKTDVAGDMPGMGPYMGTAVEGYDNVSKKFVGTWVDNHSTGIMNGTAERSADGNTMSWSYTFNCPMTKKPSVFRMVQHNLGTDAMKVEMFCTDPKSNKEYKCMEVDLKRGA